MPRNEEKIIKEQSFFPPAASNLFQERKTTRTQVAASFHERGKENPSNYVGNRDGTFHQNGEKATHYPRVMANRYCF
jgi:hypothetical protein